ncbi:MAG: hypothetical protein ACREJ3_06610 [Polyangiaceae bacterium]
MKSPAIVLIALALTAVTQSAQAADPAADGDWLTPTNRADHREAMTRFELGYRGSFVPDSGFDPFSSQGFVPEVSLAASRTLFVYRHVSFAVGLAWDNGSASSAARGDATSLTLNRVTAPLEGRVHFGPWGYAFLRLAPGVAALHTQLTDASSPDPLSKTAWLFATDVSAGYAFLLWPRWQASELLARLWVQPEIGFGWVAQERLNLGPDQTTGTPANVSGVDLGTLTMSGAFFRLAAAVSF